MKQIGAHYVCTFRVYPMHYIEWDDAGLLRGIFPLDKEQEGVTFVDGILIPVHAGAITRPEEILEHLIEQQEKYPEKTVMDLIVESDKLLPFFVDDVLDVFHLYGSFLPAAKLSTSDGSRNCYIERL